MPVPKAETRLPFSFQAADLGQTVATGNGHAVLVSYYASPLAQGRKQTYVLFVTNPTLQGNLQNIRWQVNNEDVTNQETVWEFTPADTGSFELNVTLLDNSNVELETLTLTQVVAPVNQELENLIELDDATHPVAGDPTTSREIINDLLVHLHDIADASSNEILNRLLFGISYIEANDHDQAARDRLIGQLRTHVNGGQAANFFQDAAPGAGICRLRPEILAMTIQSGASPLIPWELLPQDDAALQTALTRIRAALAALSENHRIDLFNVLRFPKASLKATKMIVDNIRAQLFSNNSLETIMTNTANATSLLNHFKTGPLAPPTP
ncbi:MAG: hypothetical protein AAF990_19240 [Bacteroidota bacterium]